MPVSVSTVNKELISPNRRTFGRPCRYFHANKELISAPTSS
jgi:hypothetical protein